MRPVLRAGILAALGSALGLSACASTLDHQAELLLHPRPEVQAPALAGAVPGFLLGSPIWGPVALVAGPSSETAAWAVHVFVYPGVLLLAGLPRLVAGPSWELTPPRTSPPGPGRPEASGASP